MNRPIQIYPEGGLYVIFGRRRFSIADFDIDGDVDLNDFAQFALCFAGSFNPPAVSCPPGIDADFDDDADVDLSDYAMFSQQFTGPR